MAPVTTIPAQALARLAALDPSRRARVLDIAAGHGKFGIAFAKEYPEAEIVALDWPNVLEVAVENAKAEGIGARYKTIAGSAFDVDFGNDYEIHVESAACNGLVAGSAFD